MGNTTTWLAQALCPEEQALWVAAKAGDAEALRLGLARLTPETRHFAEWRDPVYGYSPLANACAEGHLPCVVALVAAGVDCNARDLQGLTPLHIATRQGKSEVVRALLDTLAVDLYAKTAGRAQTALDIARHEYQAADGRAHGYIQCIEMIEKVRCQWAECTSGSLTDPRPRSMSPITTETVSLLRVALPARGQPAVAGLGHVLTQLVEEAVRDFFFNGHWRSAY